MREICSYGSVGEPVGNHRLYPDDYRFKFGTGTETRFTVRIIGVSFGSELTVGGWAHRCSANLLACV